MISTIIGGAIQRFLTYKAIYIPCCPCMSICTLNQVCESWEKICSIGRSLRLWQLYNSCFNYKVDIFHSKASHKNKVKYMLLAIRNLSATWVYCDALRPWLLGYERNKNLHVALCFPLGGPAYVHPGRRYTCMSPLSLSLSEVDKLRVERVRL